MGGRSRTGVVYSVGGPLRAGNVSVIHREIYRWRSRMRDRES